MIMYFNEFIRTHYFLPVNPEVKEFVQALSRKSGVSLIQAESLFNAIHQVSEQSEVSDFELLSLNEQIQQFIKQEMMEEHLFEQKGEIAALNEVLDKIRAEIGKVIIGQQAMVDLMLTGLLCDGHILVEGFLAWPNTGSQTCGSCH